MENKKNRRLFLMANKKKNTKKIKEKEEICEVFELEEGGREKAVKLCGVEEKTPATNKQIKEENKVLKKILIGLGVLILVLIAGYFIINSLSSFKYKGVNFNIIKEGEILFYHTSFPLKYNGNDVNYNVYLRNDPRKLEDVQFNGNITLMEMMVINNTDGFVCDGDGGIAMYNFKQIVNAIGITTMQDPNASCDPQGRYTFIKIDKGDITEIKQTGHSCYEFYVSNCEILKVTEKFLVETLVKFNEQTKKLLSFTA